MQIGVSNFSSNNRSVGQRIKDAHLCKESLNLPAYTNENEDTFVPKRKLRQSRTVCPSCDKKKSHQGSPASLSPFQRNTVRIIGQYLRDLGMGETVDSLIEESGCRIENPLSAQLRDYVSRSSWNKSLDIIEKFRSYISEQQYLTVRVLLLEEKFKEHILRGETLLALKLLQFEYPKNDEVKHRLEYWAAVLCSTDPANNFKNHFNARNSDNCLEYSSSNQYVLNILRKILPPNLMLPPNRLQELLKQSWLHQVKQCELHLNSNDETLDSSILVDHQCTNSEFPSKNITTLFLHNAEVWCLKFSPCGRFLASGAKGNNVLVWKVHSAERITIHQNITIHQDIVGIGSISWSYDSKYLAVSSTEENNFGVFIYYIPSGRLVKEYHRNISDSASAVSFFKNRSYKLACGDQRGHFQAYDIHAQDDSSLGSFEGFRIRCIYSMRDGKTVLAADTHNRIRSYDFEAKTESTIIQENSQIMYFVVDRNERFCLVTTKTEGIRLWCLKTYNLIRTFLGASHNEFIITTSFGGSDNNFFASGSEGFVYTKSRISYCNDLKSIRSKDETVVIWNINCTQPVRKLFGHSGTVNTVAWNPTLHGMLASGSDDGTIRIWSSVNSLK